MGLCHGYTARSGDTLPLPDMEKDAGAKSGLVARIVGDEGAEFIAAVGGNHGFGAGPIDGDLCAIDDLVVEA